MALANLAHQPSSPETLAAMREIDQRLSETDRNEKDLPAQLSQNQQETADAAQELAKLQAMQQALRERGEGVSRRMRSPRARIGCASRTSWNTSSSAPRRRIRWSRAAKRWGTVQHLAPSPQVESLLAGPASNTKSDTHLEQMRDCINKSGDVQGCRQASHGE